MAFGARLEHTFGHIQKSQASNSSKAMMALTGFLLAISFNIADRTFNERKWLVLNEANVVTTTFLRSYFLPEEHRAPFQKLLKKYLVTRISAVSLKEYQKGIKASEQIHRELWQIVRTATKGEKENIKYAMLIQSLNEVIDKHQERVTLGLYYSLPARLIYALLLGTLFSLANLGFSYGLNGNKNVYLAIGPVILFTAAALFIIDLGQMDHRFIEVRQEPLEDALRFIKTNLKSM